MCVTNRVYGSVRDYGWEVRRGMLDCALCVVWGKARTGYYGAGGKPWVVRPRMVRFVAWRAGCVFVLFLCQVVLPNTAVPCSPIEKVKWGVQRIWASRNRVYSAVKPLEVGGYFVDTPVQLAIATHVPERTMLFQSTFHDGELSSIEPDRLGDDDEMAFAVVHGIGTNVSFCKINVSSGNVAKVYSSSIDVEHIVVGLSASFRRTTQTHGAGTLTLPVQEYYVMTFNPDTQTTSVYIFIVDTKDEFEVVSMENNIFSSLNVKSWDNRGENLMLAVVENGDGMSSSTFGDYTRMVNLGNRNNAMSFSSNDDLVSNCRSRLANASLQNFISYGDGNQVCLKNVSQEAMPVVTSLSQVAVVRDTGGSTNFRNTIFSPSLHEEFLSLLRAEQTIDAGSPSYFTLRTSCDVQNLSFFISSTLNTEFLRPLEEIQQDTDQWLQEHNHGDPAGTVRTINWTTPKESFGGIYIWHARGLLHSELFETTPVVWANKTFSLKNVTVVDTSPPVINIVNVREVYQGTTIGLGFKIGFYVHTNAKLHSSVPMPVLATLHISIGANGINHTLPCHLESDRRSFECFYHITEDDGGGGAGGFHSIYSVFSSFGSTARQWGVVHIRDELGQFAKGWDRWQFVKQQTDYITRSTQRHCHDAHYRKRAVWTRVQFDLFVECLCAS